MEVRCPNCSSRFNLPEQFAKAGTKLRCTVCKTVFAFDPAEQLMTQGLLPDMPVKGGVGLEKSWERCCWFWYALACAMGIGHFAAALG